jgi:hypothetical protein
MSPWGCHTDEQASRPEVSRRVPQPAAALDRQPTGITVDVVLIFTDERLLPNQLTH